VLWLLLYRFSFADTLLCGWMSRPSPGARVPVLTAPSDTCRMRAASHEIFARAQTLAAKDTCCDTAVVGSYRKYMYCSSISPYIHTYIHTYILYRQYQLRGWDGHQPRGSSVLRAWGRRSVACGSFTFTCVRLLLRPWTTCSPSVQQ
jgi:hypothetical protein